MTSITTAIVATTFAIITETQLPSLQAIQHKVHICYYDNMMSFCKGERDGISTSLKQSQELISEEREKVNQLQKKLFEEQNRSERLKNEKNEVWIFLYLIFFQTIFLYLLIVFWY